MAVYYISLPYVMSDFLAGHSEHFEAEAEYDFEAENEDEVSFQAGDTLRVAPKHKQPHVRGWLLATVDGRVAGLVPANHIKVYFAVFLYFVSFSVLPLFSKSSFWILFISSLTFITRFIARCRKIHLKRLILCPIHHTFCQWAPIYYCLVYIFLFTLQFLSDFSYSDEFQIKG